MGEVWLARHFTLGSPVAVKMIRPEAAVNDRSLVRFQREAQLLARISSAHVVKVIDHGKHGELPYIVMEYLEGESLRDRLARRGRLSVEETGHVVKQVCRALTQSHALGLVHRDIKPANLFITRADADASEVLKVLDFGVAKTTDLLTGGFDPTQSGTLLGTPYYVSPEQAEGRTNIDYRADLWSVGVVAYECLVGWRPFDAPSVGALLAVITTGPVPIPSQMAPDAYIPPHVDRWMAKALTRYREARFNSAMEMADAYWDAAGMSSAGSGAHPVPAAVASTMKFDAQDAQLPVVAAQLAAERHSVQPEGAVHHWPGVPPPVTDPIPAALAPTARYAGLVSESLATPPPAMSALREASSRTSTVGLVVLAITTVAVAGAGGAWWALRMRATPEAAGDAPSSSQDRSAGGVTDSSPSSDTSVKEPPADDRRSDVGADVSHEPSSQVHDVPKGPPSGSPRVKSRSGEPSSSVRRVVPPPTGSSWTHRREL